MPPHHHHLRDFAGLHAGVAQGWRQEFSVRSIQGSIIDSNSAA